MELCLQHFEGKGPVLMLGAFILTYHDNPCWFVGQANGRIRSIDALTSVTPGTKNIHFYIFLLYTNLSHFADFRQNLNKGKGSMTHFFSIKGRDAHQTMNTCFRLEITVSIAALHVYRGTLQAGFLSARFIHNTRLPTLFFRETKQHAKKHPGPILGVHSTCAGMNSYDRVIFIIFLIEQNSEFQPPE